MKLCCQNKYNFISKCDYNVTIIINYKSNNNKCNLIKMKVKVSHKHAPYKSFIGTIYGTTIDFWQQIHRYL